MLVITSHLNVQSQVASKSCATCLQGCTIYSFLSGGPGKGGSGSPSTAAIVGGVVGGLAVIALAVVIVVVFLRKGQKAKNDDNRASKY